MKRLFFAFFLMANIALAQKLPNIQQNSLRAPVKVVIDGNATEWSEQLQAYNKATELFYTIANDDNNLYLIVQAKNPRIIEKIMGVGVTFTVNKQNTKNYKDNENVAITFPLLSVANGSRILSTSGVKTINYSSVESILSSANTITSISKQSDSLIVKANKLLTSYANTIKLKGITGLPDTLAIYNEHNIKTAAIFNNNGAYTYELALPLKHLGMGLRGVNKFSYSIRLNSRLDDPKKGFAMVYKYNAAGDQVDVNQDLNSATDFWADYILAK